MVAVLLSLAAQLSAQQCVFTLSPNARSVPATPDVVGTVNITASSPSCERVATTDSPSWLTISFGNVGTGSGSFGYRVEANRTPLARSGNISVGNARFTVQQAGADCGVSLSPATGRATAIAGRGNFRLTTRCEWTATSSAEWLRLTSATSGTGDATIEYSYDANPSTQPRAASITTSGRTFQLTQDGGVCTVRLTPSQADLPGNGGSGTIAVASTCGWRAAPAQTWITISGSDSGNGNGTVAYQVAANPLEQPRTGAITIGDQTFTIRQTATDNPRITSITSAASYARDFASPGAIVAIFGNRLGPAVLAGLELTPDGQFLAKEIAATRVLFDGTPAPMIYALDSVVSAIVPYDTAGKRMVRVVVEHQGRRSAEYNLPIAATAPAIFTVNAQGSGQGAVLNEDLSLNTTFNAAMRGSIIVIYASGEGLTNPPSLDGKLTGSDLPQAVAPVIVSVGGSVAEVLYKGGVPGVTAGMVQINARVPQAAPVGNAVPLVVSIGGVQSQNGVTVAIR